VSTLEAMYQDAMLQAVFRRSDAIVGAANAHAGLAAYRNSGSLNASRAMSLMFPAVYALLGEDDFYPLARLHWLAQPPQRGDWSQYGRDFGNWLAAHNPGGVLDALPFLADLARLDDALSRCQDATNATADWATLALLEQDPATLRLVLHPSVAVLSLDFEVLGFRQAVLDAQPLTQPECKASFAMVAREGWRAKAWAADAAGACFVSHCLAGATVAQAHDAALAVDSAYDVSVWLAKAMTAQCVLRVEII
jgi:Putative DNA-binding domain